MTPAQQSTVTTSVSRDLPPSATPRPHVTTPDRTTLTARHLATYVGR